MKRILLIDDDYLVLRSLAKMLSKKGYEVITADSYEKALKEFVEDEFDLVLSDICMPGKNGVEIVSDLQKKLTAAGKEELPVIFITGYADFANELQANLLGEVLYKPVDNEELLRTIRDSIKPA